MNPHTCSKKFFVLQIVVQPANLAMVLVTYVFYIFSTTVDLKSVYVYLEKKSLYV